jgi:signal peptidase
VPRDKSAPPPHVTSHAVHTLRRVAAALLGFLLFGATAGALAIAVYPTVTSGKAMAVLSGSMTPSYPVGAMVFTRPVDPGQVAVGEIITFQRPSNPAELVTHRVVAIDTSTGAPVFTTKGDANNAADLDPVPASAVQGRLWFGVPQLGRVAAVLHSPQGLGFLVLLICGVLALSPGKRPGPARGAATTRDRADGDARPDRGPTHSEQTEAIALPQVRSLPLPPVPPSPARRLPPVPSSTRSQVVLSDS